MKTSPACLPCFERQMDYATRLATTDSELSATIHAQALEYLATLDMEAPPPLNAIGLYRLIAQRAATPDPFAHIKQQSNDLALGLKDTVQALIQQGADPMYRAVLFAIAGNIIDYGAQQDFDLDRTLASCLGRELFFNDYELLRQELQQASSILYLADNCGELVFDGLLIEQLGVSTVTLAVKDGPILNDATLEDAISCGLDRVARVITNGAICPGTPLGQCSDEFESLFAAADVVISKGQGNFETLSEIRRPVYHLLTVKCPVVATHAALVRRYPGQIPEGSALLMRLGE